MNLFLIGRLVAYEERATEHLHSLSLIERRIKQKKDFTEIQFAFFFIPEIWNVIKLSR